jgi:hypothetical protein
MVSAANCEVSIVPLQILGMEDIAASSEDSATSQRDKATVWLASSNAKSRYMIHRHTQSGTKTFILPIWIPFVHKKREIACVDHAIIVYVGCQRDGVCCKLRSVHHATSDTRDGGHRGELRRLSHFSEGQSHCVAWIVERHSRSYIYVDTSPYAEQHQNLHPTYMETFRT